MLRRECGRITITATDGFKSVEVVASFSMFGREFAINRTIEDPTCYVATELSSGCSIGPDMFETVEGAFENAKWLLGLRRLYLATCVNTACVRNKTFLNTSGVELLILPMI